MGRFALICVVCAALFAVPARAQAPQEGGATLPHRSWQFQDDNWEYLQQAIPQAARAGMNRVQLSHRIIMDAEQLWEGKDAAGRLELVRNCAKLAKEHGLAVDVWTHELSGIPKDQFREQPGGKPVLSPELWAWVTAKYEKLFELVPELDGLVLTFAETDYSVYKDVVVSDLPRAQRVAKLIEVLSDVCKKHEKLLIVRTFVYEPSEIESMREALAEIARTAQRTHNIVVMTKCVPHDWTPFYPFNPRLGDVSGLPQIVEIDLGQEFTGLSKILHCEVDYVKYVMVHARAKGVIGGVARVERMDNHALGTPNEVNIHAFNRLLSEPDLTSDGLWREWTAKRYGEKAAPHVIKALRPTFDITNLTYFPLEQWIVNHSLLPNWGYAYGHLTSRQNAKWIPSPRQLAARDELLQPRAETLIKLDAEKETARRLAEASLLDLEHAKPHLAEADYRQLKRYLELGKDNVEVFRAHNLAMFTLLHLRVRKAAGDASPEEINEIRTKVEKQIQALRQWADKMEQIYGKDVYPGNPARIRDFASDVENKLSKW